MTATDAQSPRFMSDAEQETATSLAATLPPQLVLDSTPPKIEVSLGPDDSFSYAPDFSIRNLEDGSVVPLEVMSAGSISLSNVVVLKQISDAYRDRGQDFIVLVYEESSADSIKRKRLQNEDIHSIWARDAIHAATQVSELLLSRASLPAEK